MPNRRTSATVTRKYAQLAWAAPQVIAHRSARMAAAGAAQDPRDAAEFTRMFTEKSTAFSQAWLESSMALYWAPWKVLMELLLGGATLARPGASSIDPMLRAWRREGWAIAGAAVEPVHRAAVANARRLARQWRS